MSQETWEAFQQGFIGNETLEIALGMLAAFICIAASCILISRGK